MFKSNFFWDKEFIGKQVAEKKLTPVALFLCKHLWLITLESLSDIVLVFSLLILRYFSWLGCFHWIYFSI